VYCSVLQCVVVVCCSVLWHVASLNSEAVALAGARAANISHHQKILEQKLFFDERASLNIARVSMQIHDDAVEILKSQLMYISNDYRADV